MHLNEHSRLALACIWPLLISAWLLTTSVCILFPHKCTCLALEGHHTLRTEQENKITNKQTNNRTEQDRTRQDRNTRSQTNNDARCFSGANGALCSAHTHREDQRLGQHAHSHPRRKDHKPSTVQRNFSRKVLCAVERGQKANTSKQILHGRTSAFWKDHQNLYTTWSCTTHEQTNECRRTHPRDYVHSRVHFHDIALQAQTIKFMSTHSQ